MNSSRRNRSPSSAFLRRLRPAVDDLIERHEGEHVAIISRAEWEALQRLFNDPMVATQRRVQNHEYFLRGVLKCGRCARR